MKIRAEKIRTGESEQHRTEIAKSRSFVYLVMFIKPISRQSNTVCIGNSSLVIMKRNNLASFSSIDTYVIVRF